MTHFLQRLTILLAGLCLSACITLEPGPEPAARPPAGTITGFSLTGRLSIRQEDKSYQAGIQWQHSPGHDTILLTGPLGQGLAELESDAAGARLTTADQKTTTASNADELARAMLGFDLPLSALPSWALGQQQTVAEWQATVLRRESDTDNALPVLLEMKRGEDLTVRLKIDEWQIP